MVTVEDFKEAWDSSPKDDRSVPMGIAEQYVEENKALLETLFAGKDTAELCDLISAFRQAGNHKMALAGTMWELVKFPRQQIGGFVRPGRGA